jgi:hypothetical protein
MQMRKYSLLHTVRQKYECRTEKLQRQEETERMIHKTTMLQCRSCIKATAFCDWNICQAQALEEYPHLSMQIHKQHECVDASRILLIFASV